MQTLQSLRRHVCNTARVMWLSLMCRGLRWICVACRWSVERPQTLNRLKPRAAHGPLLQSSRPAFPDLTCLERMRTLLLAVVCRRLRLHATKRLHAFASRAMLAHSPCRRWFAAELRPPPGTKKDAAQQQGQQQGQHGAAAAGEGGAAGSGGPDGKSTAAAPANDGKGVVSPEAADRLAAVLQDKNSALYRAAVKIQARSVHRFRMCTSLRAKL